MYFGGDSAHVCHGTCVEARGAGSLLPLWAFQSRTRVVRLSGKHLHHWAILLVPCLS